MNVLKNMFFFFLLLELVILLCIMTEKSLEKMSIMSQSLHKIAQKSVNYSADVTLDAIVQRENAIEGLINSMVSNKFVNFTSSSHLPFIYQAYRKNRYLPLVWLDSTSQGVSLDKEVEKNAKKLLGRRYVWGAVGPNTFDCSGFTMKVFRKVGINLPRVSRNQAKVGKLVKFDELQRGDMVFFDTSRAHRGKVNHVGIYLGDGEFIHASSGKKRVVITSFNKKRFYRDRFLWGRRVLKEKVNYAFDTLPWLPKIKAASGMGLINEYRAL